MDTTAPNPTLECPQCAGEARVLSTVSLRSSHGILYRCLKCNFKISKLTLDPDDPEDVHRLIRRKLNALLKPLPVKPPSGRVRR